ncbi:hypothetical protein FQR65_LT01340 [Abscondita terminalis]|nr:hypothetical protein FQR65_LT01340 [Abscondita terminalis]
MGCNTSKDTLQPTEEEKDKNENNKVDENNVNEALEIKEEKPPSAKTITINNTENSTGTKEEAENEEVELEQAATKIQAAFRGHQTRRTMKHEDKSGKPTSAQQQQQQEQENLENELSLDDPDLAHAATKIQASFRGHMVRKQMEKDEGEQKPEKPTPEEEELDIDLTDPELNKAATKIQASFRGHAVRKETEPGHPTK